MRFLISYTLVFFIFSYQQLQGDVVIIGHRGACGHAPENTLASFAKALEIGVDAVELDVHLAKSGELVVIHDETVDRVANGKGNVADKTLAELKEYTLVGKEKIPTLDQVCALIDKRCIINIELKGVSTARPVAHMIKNLVLKKGWDFEHFFVSSFNPFELRIFHQLLPMVKTGALLSAIHPSFAEYVGATHVVLHYEHVNLECIQDARNHGLQVFVYTVNDPKDMKHLIEMGVDGIITDFPDRCIHWKSKELGLFGS
jgi:glycerophosphoryl diester phosphodiesterase